MAFRFLHRWISSLEDATQNFEQLEALLSGGSGQQAAVLQLLSTQKLQLAIGSTTVATPAWNNATNIQVAVGHTFGAVPQLIIPTIMSGQSIVNNVLIGAASAYTANNFTLDLYNASGGNAAASAIEIGWAAIG